MQMISFLTKNKFLLFIGLVASLVACQGTSSSTAVLPSSVIETATAEILLQATNTLRSPSSTPTPRQILLSEGEPPPFIVSKGSLPQKPGIYLIYGDRSARIKYISHDGYIRGDLLQYRNINQDNSWSPLLSMTSEYGSPKLIFTDEHDTEANVWVTDLTGGALKSLHVNFGNDGSANCNVPSFSSRERWLGSLCHVSNTDYAYFSDLDTSEERIIPLGVACSTEYETLAPGFPEPEDKTWWSLRCNEPNIYCFISSEYDKAICRSFDEPPVSTSPDGSKIVVLKNGRPYNSDKTVSGIQIEIVDRECLLTKTPCEQGLEFDLPYYKSIYDSDLSGPRFSFDWDPAGQALAWQNAPIAHIETERGIVEAPSVVGWIDLNKNTNQIIWPHLPMFTHLLGRSPDGKWLLFSDLQGLYLGSTETHIIRRLVVSDGYTPFYGWLVVP